VTEIDLSDLEITEDDLRQAQAAWEARLTRLKHPYVFDLIRVVAPHRAVKRTIALDIMWRTRIDLGLPIPPSFNETVQASLQYYCADSDVFKARQAPPGDGVFSWPKGKRAGVWAVNRDYARAWVITNRQLLPGRVLSDYQR